MSEFEWLLIELRSEGLTEFFTLIPIMASSLFYMSIIAIGFWLRPGGTTFAQLGVLMPISILLNLILKNSFAILRPEEDLHLIPVDSMLSFPSGNIMIAVIFWGVIAMRWNKPYARFLSIFMINVILISRIYLGVSNLADAIGGLAFGLLAMVFWRGDLMQNTYNKWLNKGSLSYWGMLWLLFCCYFLTVEDDIYSENFVVATGALVGFGLSLKTISKWRFEPGMFSTGHLSSIALSFIMLATLSKVIPTINTDTSTKIISGILEYTLLMFMIFCIFPRLQRAIARKEQSKQK
jgi:membrane-associated phospholipid phosphatase